ncbi:carbohydrate ABC transporter permease [Halalkalibacter hemicellulosilyticus]|uniref:N-acetyl-D-glucosamine ABC transport system n=1 Tax=Halalkalibacter hemicellulosilyticusJCM 9152 TaxID=1236971 RepID=W4QLD0_9BACI|nr:carbohydrate ABC transporter permease [Halalkalibacter hemicellulosilyticus]GAE32164.1 N-acetyl-D-glucosamine ABC transport system [Halalkalibacter hemicellulosilyticusJCM 9152]
MKRNDIKSKTVKLMLTVFMLLMGIIFLLPFIWMISASLKPELEVFAYPIQWIPSEWRWSNYVEVWSGDFPLYYWNSIKVTVMTTLISTTVSTLAAYGFSKIHFKGRHLIFILVLATFMIPAQAILVPQFMLYMYLDLFDTHLGLILLNSFSVLGTFMLRQFFMGIHDDYIASAKIDGAGHLTIFRKVAVPLVLPAISTYAILRFIWTWNDYQGPLIFLRSDHLSTVQIGISRFTSMSGEYYSLIMAGTVSAILPLLIIFFFGQKYVIEGIAMGGVKG